MPRPPTDLAIAEDWLCLLALAEGGPVALVEEPLLTYRLYENQMSSVGRAMKTAQEILAAFELLERRCEDVEIRRELFRLIGRQHLEVAHHLTEVQPSTSLIHGMKAVTCTGVSPIVANLLVKALRPQPIRRRLTSFLHHSGR